MTRTVILLVWLFSLGVVYVLGLLTTFSMYAPGGGRGVIEDQNDIVRAEYAALVARMLPGRSVDWEGIDDMGGAPAVPEQMLQLTALLGSQRDRVFRESAAKRMAAALPNRKVPDAIMEILKQPAGAGRDAFLWALFLRWGEIDGRSAVSFVVAMPDAHSTLREVVMLAAIEGWASVNAENAWNWVMRSPASIDERIVRASTVLDAVEAPQLIVFASPKISGLEAPLAKDNLTSFVAQRLYQNLGVNAAFEFIEGVSNSPAERISQFSLIIEDWAAEDPVQASQWYATLDSETYAWVMEPVATSWAKRDGASALNWLLQQPPTDARSYAVSQASRSWVDVAGPGALGTYLSNLEDFSGLNPAIEVLALETMDFDPATALSWSNVIGDDSRRRYLSAVIGGYWMDLEPEVAQPEIRKRISDPVVRSILLGESEARVITTAPSRQVVHLNPGQSVEVIQSSPDDAPVYVEIGPSPEGGVDEAPLEDSDSYGGGQEVP